MAVGHLDRIRRVRRMHSAFLM